MAQIFISYSRRNLDAIKTLANNLEEAGNRVWFDQALIGGEYWWDNILASIRKSDIFVFVITPESLKSHPCKQEWTYASQLRKALLPILLSPVDINLIPRHISEIHHVDYQRQDRQAAFALIKAINSLSSPSPRPLPDPLPEPPPIPIFNLNDLKEQIDATENLNFQQQSNLVSILEEHLREGRSPAEVYNLLLRLKARPDLLARIKDEIDAVEEIGRVKGSVDMDPITTALIAAFAKLSDTVIRDAYDALKGAISRRIGPNSNLVKAAEKLEQKPDAPGGQEVLQAEVTAAHTDQDDDILRAAKALIEKLKLPPETVRDTPQRVAAGESGSIQDVSVLANDATIHSSTVTIHIGHSFGKKDESA